jgi:hypothetical protein
MNTPAYPLKSFKFQYSKNLIGARFSHTVIDKYPSLSYRFSQGDNWKATDYRIKDKWTEVSKWFDNYWDLRCPNNRTNGDLFEDELEDVILKSYEKIKEKWTLKMERDFEKEFAEDLVKFLHSKSSP